MRVRAASAALKARVALDDKVKRFGLDHKSAVGVVSNAMNQLRSFLNSRMTLTVSDASGWRNAMRIRPMNFLLGQTHVDIKFSFPAKDWTSCRGASCP